MMIMIGHAISAAVFLLPGLLAMIMGIIFGLIDGDGIWGLAFIMGAFMALWGGGILGLGFLWQHLFG